MIKAKYITVGNTAYVVQLIGVITKDDFGITTKRAEVSFNWFADVVVMHVSVDPIEAEKEISREITRLDNDLEYEKKVISEFEKNGWT